MLWKPKGVLHKQNTELPLDLRTKSCCHELGRLGILEDHWVLGERTK